MNSSNQPQISNKVVETLVQSILTKNGVKLEEVKKNISVEQRQMIKEMVEDLKRQVEEFNNKQITEE